MNRGNPDRYEQQLELPGISSWANGASFSPDGKLLAISSTRDRTIRIWDVEGETYLHEISAGGVVNSIAYHPDGTMVAACVQASRVIFIDPRKGEVLDRVELGDDQALFVAFRPGTSQVAISATEAPEGLKEPPIRLWDVEAKKETARCSGHPLDIRSLAFHPGGRVLASGGVYHRIRLWDPESGRLIRELLGHTKEVTDLAFSRDGKTLYSSGAKGDDIRLWDWQSGKELRVIPTRGAPALAVRADGTLLVHSTYEGYLELWDLSLMRELHVWEGHSGSVPIISFSPDGRLMATASADKSIKIWSLK